MKSPMKIALLSSPSLMRQREVVEVMKNRRYSWNCEKFRFTKYNNLNCNLAKCMKLDLTAEMCTEVARG